MSEDTIVIDAEEAAISIARELEELEPQCPHCGGVIPKEDRGFCDECGEPETIIIRATVTGFTLEKCRPCAKGYLQHLGVWEVVRA